MSVSSLALAEPGIVSKVAIARGQPEGSGVIGRTRPLKRFQCEPHVIICVCAASW